MKQKKYIISVLVLLLTAAQAAAKITVEATIDSIQILVGQQAHVTLKVTSAYKDKLELPPFKPNTVVLPNVELLDISEPDTADFDGNRVVSQIYTFTSFDANLYYLPPFPVKVNGKEYKSESLAMKVLTIDVDTTQLDKFFPPKDVQNNPFLWADWYPVMTFAGLLIVCIVAYIFLRKLFKSNKPIHIKIRTIKKILPHQRALKELETLKAAMPNLQEEVGDEAPKEYYTRLTDTLRKYLVERFGFNAMEMTSAEILQNLKANSDEERLAELRMLFQTADLVKFAKYSTQMNENDMNLINAMTFINTTKLENMPEEETIRPELSETDKRSITQRRLLKTGLWILAAAGAGIIGWLGYLLYDLLA